ncbi:hypothetical protein [Colwellia sp. TT2012]|uniref:hypothetical protein n=1 Tax=Colwellia sp. TT2012 TaxID=1720342 RepID=UPI00070E1EB1|nr:hypothetical protein [Colwellia sp. TT2012]
MELTQVIVTKITGKMQRLCGTVRYDDGFSEDYYFELPDNYNVSLSGNPWFACLLPLAVTLGEDLTISLPIDPLLLNATDDLIKLWKTWYPQLHNIKIFAETAVAPQQTKDCATFFSSGVDSYFTTVRHPNAKYMLITRGFDMPYSYVDEFDVHCARIAKSAQECGGELIPTATNIRDTRWSRCHWELLGHGPALNAIALLFEQHFGEVFIPSSYEYKILHPWGSHPMVDNLFTTSNVHFIHDGCGYSRTEKIKKLCQYDHVLKNLHVCFRGSDGLGQDQGNCCNCEKCYRTMVVLELLGKLEQATLFNNAPLTPEKLTLLYGDRIFLEEIYSFAIEMDNTILARAIRQSIKRSNRIDWLKKLTKLPVIWRIAAFFYNREIKKSLT